MRNSFFIFWDKKGILHPSRKKYVHKIEGLKDLADIEVHSMGNIDSTNMDTIAII